MDAHEQREWICRHIPHRVRAAIARLPMESSLLRVQASIDPPRLTDQDEIYWRCATNSIWAGRLAATRWLIEFIGIKQGKNGKAMRAKKQQGSQDVRIDNIDGGILFDVDGAEAQFLADVWKGCSQASSHATNQYDHPSVSDQSALPAAVTLILNHLQNTIYLRANVNLRDCVLNSRD